MVLNPNAPEFYPKHRAQDQCPAKPKFLCPRPRSHHIYEPSKTFNVKPGNFRGPHRFWFCNRKCLPPRLLKPKVWVHKNQIFSRSKPVPAPEEPTLEYLLPLQQGKLESFSPPHEEAKLDSLPLSEAESRLGDKTSVMIRNIPNIFGRKDLLRILDNHCRKENKEVDEQQQTRSSYDFLYLPMDFVKYRNLGYAFVNFTSSIAAERFRREFDNFFWNNFGNRKICEITVAKYQGREEFSKHFKDSMFPCHTDAYLPVILSPPSDGFTGYSLTTLGHRASPRGGGGRCRNLVI